METEASRSPLLAYSAPPLEQGFIGLNDLGKPLPLPEDRPYSLCWRFLLCGIEKASHLCLLAAIPHAQKEESRRALSLLSRVEAFQQISLANAPRISICGRAILYSLLSIDLCAVLAQRAAPGTLRDVLQFLQPELTDELYRLSNLLALEEQAQAQEVISGFEEIFPGRPCIAAHRHPYDCVTMGTETEDGTCPLPPVLMEAALQAKYSFFLFAAGEAGNELSKGLFSELSLLTHQQLTLLSCLLPDQTPLRQSYFSQYAEAYLYSSWAQEQENGFCRSFLMEQRDREISHLQKLHHIVRKEEGIFLPCPAFPPPLRLGPNKGYIRDRLNEVGLVWTRAGTVPVSSLAPGADHCRYQKKMTVPMDTVPSHQVVEQVIRRYGTDYRFEIAQHPLEALRDRTKDDTRTGRFMP